MDLEARSGYFRAKKSFRFENGGRIMSDEIIEIVDTMELAAMVSDLSDKLNLLRSEVDTIGNVLLQVLHTPAIQMEEEK